MCSHELIRSGCPSWLAMVPTPVLQANPPKCLQRSRGRTANSGECPRPKQTLTGELISVYPIKWKNSRTRGVSEWLNLLRTVERKLESKRRKSRAPECLGMSRSVSNFERKLESQRLKSRTPERLGMSRVSDRFFVFWVAVKGDFVSPSYSATDSTQQTEPASLSGQLNL